MQGDITFTGATMVVISSLVRTKRTGEKIYGAPEGMITNGTVSMASSNKHVRTIISVTAASCKGDS